MADVIVLIGLAVVGLVTTVSAGLAAGARRAAIETGATNADGGEGEEAIQRRLDAMSDRLGAIENAVDRESDRGTTAEALEDVERRLSELEDGIEVNVDPDVDVDSDLSKLQKLDRLDELDLESESGSGSGSESGERVTSDDLEAVSRRLEAVEDRVAAVQEGLSEVPDVRTVKQPLVNIDDRLQEIDRRLERLRDRVSVDEDVSLGESLSALSGELSEVDRRLDAIESRVGGSDVESEAVTDTARADSESSGFLTADAGTGEDLGEVEETFDFDEEFLGVEDDDAA